MVLIVDVTEDCEIALESFGTVLIQLNHLLSLQLLEGTQGGLVVVHLECLFHQLGVDEQETLDPLPIQCYGGYSARGHQRHLGMKSCTCRCLLATVQTETNLRWTKLA